jgi:hypothetical protein
MTALATIESRTELLISYEHAIAVVVALEAWERATRDLHATALLVGARQLLGAVEVEIERRGGSVERALLRLSPPDEATGSECARLAAACDQLGAAVARRGGPGAAAVHFASRRLLVAVEQLEQRDRRLDAEVLRAPANPLRAAIASLSTTSPEIES